MNTWPRLSPDGRSVGFVRTAEQGQELWLRTADGTERRAAVHHGETIGDLRWSADGSWLLYRRAPRGRERWSLSALDAGTHARIDLSLPGSVTEYWLSASDPAAVLCGHRGPGSRLPDLVGVDLTAPAADPVPVAANPGFHQWLVDAGLRPRGGTRITEDGSVHVFLGEDPDAARVVFKIEAEDAADLSIQGFSRDGRLLFLLSGAGAPTRRLLSIDSETATASTVFQDTDLDVESYPIAGEGVWFDPATGLPDICAVIGQRLRYHPLTDGLERPVSRLVASARTPIIIDRSADDRTWLVVHVHDDGPIAYHLHDPATGRAEPLFVNRPGLRGHRLPRLGDFIVTAGDGLRLGGYAMRPLSGEPPFPTAVLVHGGPAGRDLWRFHAEAQYLASLGYLSLHVNYRGSRGYGSGFRQAGNGEWGGRMQQDLYDAVAEGVAAGLVDPDRVVFLGASYGGYVSLLAACTRPDLVRGAIAISPPCDLISFTAKPPSYWQPLAVLLDRQILTTRDGRRLDGPTLAARSPLHALTGSCAPLLVAHGVRDPRVPVAEVDGFVDRARALGVPIRYLRFEDEGHHVRSNANRQTLFEHVKNFLEGHLAVR
ncbi:S9 family peptidase [Planomonospora algeriensis]